MRALSPIAGLATLVFLWGLGGCDLVGSPFGSKAGDPEVPEVPTYHRDVAPVLERRCASCHQAGSLGPFPLLTLAQVQPMARLIAGAVAARRMPPFPPTQDERCPPIDDPRVMSDAEREIIARWAATGAQAGEPVARGEQQPAPGSLGPPSDRFAMDTSYASAFGGTDDYRCFLIDPRLTTPMAVSAVSAEPGNRAIVHHASVFAVPPTEAAALQALDAAEAGPGYTCFGGAGVAQAYPIGVWVPGSDAPLVPPRPTVGFFLPAGWLLVLQNHYNFDNGRGADRSAVTLWRAPGLITEIPHALYLSDGDFVLPAGQKSTVREIFAPVLPLWAPPMLGQVQEGSIYSVWAHMHLLGRSFAMDLLRPDGSEQCLLRIPAWDFHWQSIYRLKKAVVARPGDRVRLRCEWDNSPEHQPIIGGARQAPREVRYGEKSTDEMCLGTLALTAL